MSKKKPGSAAAGSPRPASTARIQQQLRRLSREIMQLCNERARLVSDAQRPQELLPGLTAE